MPAGILPEVSRATSRTVWTVGPSGEDAAITTWRSSSHEAGRRGRQRRRRSRSWDFMWPRTRPRRSRSQNGKLERLKRVLWMRPVEKLEERLELVLPTSRRSLRPSTTPSRRTSRIFLKARMRPWAFRSSTRTENMMVAWTRHQSMPRSWFPRREGWVKVPVLKALETASDDLYSWAAARVAREEGVRLEDLLEEMALFGASDLAQEASSLLEGVGHQNKAGERPRFGRQGNYMGYRRTRSRWSGAGWRRMEDVGLPGRSDDVRRAGCHDEGCGADWRRRGSALQRRLRQASYGEQALDAHDQMGEAAEFVTPVEHELRCQAHDVLHPHHERDFRTLGRLPRASAWGC